MDGVTGEHIAVAFLVVIIVHALFFSFNGPTSKRRSRQVDVAGAGTSAGNDGVAAAEQDLASPSDSPAESPRSPAPVGLRNSRLSMLAKARVPSPSAADSIATREGRRATPALHFVARHCDGAMPRTNLRGEFTIVLEVCRAYDCAFENIALAASIDEFGRGVETAFDGDGVGHLHQIFFGELLTFADVPSRDH